MTVTLDEVKAIRQHDKVSISLSFCQSITAGTCGTAVLWGIYQHHYDKVKVNGAEKGFRIMKGGETYYPCMSMMHSILLIMNSVEALNRVTLS